MWCNRIYFTLTEAINKLIPKKSRLCIIGSTVRDRKVAAQFLLVKNCSTKFWQNLFYQLSLTLHDVMQQQIESLEFVQDVDFQFFDPLKNNGTKYLLIIDDSCEKTCISKILLFLPLLKDIADWLLFKLGTNCFIKKTRARCSTPKFAHWSLQISTWYDASQYAHYTNGSWIRASWLASRRNFGSLQ